MLCYFDKERKVLAPQRLHLVPAFSLLPVRLGSWGPMLAPAFDSLNPFGSDNAALRRLIEAPVSDKDGFGVSLGLVSAPCQLSS